MADAIRLSLWGTSRSGKTVYLIALFWAFQRLSDAWTISAMDDESQAFLDQAREDFFVRHKFPEKTHEMKKYRYQLTETSTGEIYELEFIDAPGELYLGYYDTSIDKKQRHTPVYVAQDTSQDQKTSLTPQQMFETLATSHGIVTLIDPAWKLNPLRAQPYDQLLAQVFRDLNRHTTEKPFIALCYTKVDGNQEVWDIVTEAEKPFPPLKTCYRQLPVSVDGKPAAGKTPEAAKTQCAETCKIYQELGSTLMDYQLEIPGHQFRCFHISSIGRTAKGKSNVGIASPWERSEIAALKPPVFQMPVEDPHAAQNLRKIFNDPLNEVPVDSTGDVYMPTSVNEPNAITPYQVAEPVIWLIDQLKTRLQKSPARNNGLMTGNAMD